MQLVLKTNLRIQNVYRAAENMAKPAWQRQRAQVKGGTVPGSVALAGEHAEQQAYRCQQDNVATTAFFGQVGICHAISHINFYIEKKYRIQAQHETGQH